MNTSKYLSRLTQTEQLVLQLIAYEHSSKEIASVLFVSEQTVFTHRANLLLKLDVKNAAGLIRKAIEHNLLRPWNETINHPRLCA